MKKAVIPQFLQFVAVILFCFLLIYIVAQQLGAGQATYKAIERASLIYTVSASANALSVVDEGYVRKEMTQKYDITIRPKESEGGINYYVTATLSDAASSDNVVFSHEEGTCGSFENCETRAENGDIIFYGSVKTPNPCYELEARLELSGSNLDVIIQPKKQKDKVCSECTGSVRFTGRVKNMAPGTYQVRVIKKYQYKDEPDTVLDEKETEIDYIGVGEEVDDDEKFFLLTTDVVPTVIINADCVRIVKEPGKPVRFEKCTRTRFTDKFTPGGSTGYGGGGASD